jgi:hypothetical protein
LFLIYKNSKKDKPEDIQESKKIFPKNYTRRRGELIEHPNIASRLESSIAKAKR